MIAAAVIWLVVVAVSGAALWFAERVPGIGARILPEPAPLAHEDSCGIMLGYNACTCGWVERLGGAA